VISKVSQSHPLQQWYTIGVSEMTLSEQIIDTDAMFKHYHLHKRQVVDAIPRAVILPRTFNSSI
jgi:hypothetical protein